MSRECLFNILCSLGPSAYFILSTISDSLRISQIFPQITICASQLFSLGSVDLPITSLILEFLKDDATPEDNALLQTLLN